MTETSDTKPESDGELLARMGTDAAVWAAELVKSASAAADREGTTMTEILADPEPGAFLHAWLCNAIEAGRSAGYVAGRSAADASWGHMIRDQATSS